MVFPVTLALAYDRIDRNAMSLSAGTRLRPSEILAPIGAGGMVEVYRARDPRMGRDVALRLARDQFSIPVFATVRYSPKYLVM